MSFGWSLWIGALVLLQIVGCVWLLWVNRTATIEDVGKGDPLESEHDGIVELNNPLPAWWSWLFVVTLVFSVVYLAAYPGMGSFAGWLGWSSQSKYEAEVAEADRRYGPIFAAFAARDVEDLVGEPQAVAMGGRLFANHCSTCHGSDARGSRGYPNLTDDDWLYGGDPEAIVRTITLGRVGAMPAQIAPLGGPEGVEAMVHYVLSLSGREHDEALAAQAAPQFQTFCSVCHGPDGRGKQLVGGANLTDDIWLHGGTPRDIEYQITQGRINMMPAHRDILTPEKIHLLATYVYSLSHDAPARESEGAP